LHGIAEELGLISFSRGEGSDRQIIIAKKGKKKPNKPEELKEQITKEKTSDPIEVPSFFSENSAPFDRDFFPKQNEPYLDKNDQTPSMQNQTKKPIYTEIPKKVSKAISDLEPKEKKIMLALLSDLNQRKMGRSIRGKQKKGKK
jgi:hypothetical protein